MTDLKTTFIEKVVQNCFNVYNKLPKNGKPIENEWTVLSCFVEFDKTTEKIEVVSLGTGSKCIGATKMTSNGSILNDSHAEVFARRGFLLYLYENVEKALNNKLSIFNNDNQQLKLNDNIEFMFYSSQLPCGDASIISQQHSEEEHYGNVLTLQKRPADEEVCDIEIKKPKFDEYVNKTGAKCLPHCEQDEKDLGTNIQLHLGQVRTKPGRGDRTLSVSCSDKIAKWIHLGVQGSLLNILCKQVYIKHFIFGGGVSFSKETLQRALLNRSDCSYMLDIMPEFYQTSIVFPNISSDVNIKPAPGSIVWIKLSSPVMEVAVQGRKLGVTVKKAASPACSLCISKYNLYKRFLQILNNNDDMKEKICGHDNISDIPYNVMKRKSEKYYEKWLDVKEKFFKTWTIKPDMWNFCVNVNMK